MRRHKILHSTYAITVCVANFLVLEPTALIYIYTTLMIVCVANFLVLEPTAQ